LTLISVHPRSSAARFLNPYRYRLNQIVSETYIGAADFPRFPHGMALAKQAQVDFSPAGQY